MKKVIAGGLVLLACLCSMVVKVSSQDKEPDRAELRRQFKQEIRVAGRPSEKDSSLSLDELVATLKDLKAEQAELARKQDELAKRETGLMQRIDQKINEKKEQLDRIRQQVREISRQQVEDKIPQQLEDRLRERQQRLREIRAGQKKDK